MTQAKLTSKATTNLTLNLRVKSCFRRGIQLAGTIGLLWAFTPAAQAQVPLKMTAIDAPFVTGTSSQINTTNASPSNGAYPSNAAITINFGATAFNDRVIKTFSVLDPANNPQKFNFGGLLTDIYIRRNNVNFPNSDRQLAFFEKSSNTSMVSSYAPNMETILRSSFINRGTDNTFANTGNSAGNNSNIERIDFVTQSGLTSPSADQINDIGFLILERGGNDNIKVAAILSVDGSGKPTSFGPVVSKAPADWGKTGPTIGYSVMRKDVSDPDWRPSDTNAGQQISGLYFSLGSLSVPPNTVIYGYSIIPHDVTTPNTNPALLDWTTYPTGTTEGSGSGLDLMAGGGVFVTHTITGTVFGDPNGSKVQELPGEAGVSDGLKAVLMDSLGTILQVQSVATDGAYKFRGVATPPVGSPYTVLITTTPPALNSVNLNPTITLPTGYVSTGENKSGTPDATVDARVAVSVNDFTPLAGQPSSGQPVLTEAVKINFGIEKLPTAIGASTTSQANPGTNVSVPVPANLFNTSTDPDGTVDNYRITTFPTNATSIEIDGVVYTVAGGNGTTAFPSTGVTVPSTKLNTIKIDPIDGAVNVTIPFKAIDNAGKESTNIAEAIVPFTASAVASPPELILLKRITKINNLAIGKKTDGTPIDLTLVVPQPDNPATPRDESSDASNPNWTTNYPKGAIDAGVVKSGDLVEYTIYFLSAGGKPVTNANFCDWVPKNTIFVPDSFGIGRGIQLAIGSILNTFTNVPDGDRAVFYNPGAIPPATYPSGATYQLNCMTPMGVDGAVVVNLVNNTIAAPENQLPNATSAGTPGNSYGFVRFVSKVK